jgi:predicted DNA-binding protein
MVTISLKVPDELARRIEAEARSRHISKSAVVRECLERSLETSGKVQPSFYDLAKDLCGTVKSGVPDLATNPKYLEGFGE